VAVFCEIVEGKARCPLSFGDQYGGWAGKY
jgi:hypothetical protein